VAYWVTRSGAMKSAALLYTVKLRINVIPCCHPTPPPTPCWDCLSYHCPLFLAECGTRSVCLVATIGMQSNVALRESNDKKKRKQKWPKIWHQFFSNHIISLITTHCILWQSNFQSISYQYTFHMYLRIYLISSRSSASCWYFCCSRPQCSKCAAFKLCDCFDYVQTQPQLTNYNLFQCHFYG